MGAVTALIATVENGDIDAVVADSSFADLQQASQNPQNQLWVVPQAGHVRAYIIHPEEYINKVTAFFDATLR